MSLKRAGRITPDSFALKRAKESLPHSCVLVSLLCALFAQIPCPAEELNKTSLSIKQTEKSLLGEQSDERVTTLRSQIEAALKRARPDAESITLHKRLLRFEVRVSATGQKQQVEDCYLKIATALGECAGNPEELSSAGLLAEHLIIELADPSQVNQGNHNTCALAALQAVLYARDPARVCEIVFQARKGSLSNNAGKHIRLREENLTPDEEARSFRVDSIYRSYAGQLFQIAAANYYWQSQTKDPQGRDVPAGSISYVQDYSTKALSSRDTRERLIINWSAGVKEIVADALGMPEMGPAFNLQTIDTTYKLLSGRANRAYILCHKANHGSSPAITFACEKDLSKHLQSLKDKGNLPAIISIASSGAAPGHRLVSLQQRNEPSSLRNSNCSHVVCIYDYERETDKVAVDNFWGPADDHLAANASELHDLYQRSCPAQTASPTQTASLTKQTQGYHLTWGR